MRDEEEVYMCGYTTRCVISGDLRAPQCVERSRCRTRTTIRSRRRPLCTTIRLRRWHPSVPAAAAYWGRTARAHTRLPAPPAGLWPYGSQNQRPHGPAPPFTIHNLAPNPLEKLKLLSAVAVKSPSPFVLLPRCA